ncbi:hypothetical protein M422DRAFT_262452 [Sphaerobolus stellatus SS14]|uniref:Uncharacterized protein n=1 Tax=Sphaerobolus stellatus (strain SS14) TaxID=990650 RepID=A0A0C9VD08_SPHS4|nr:hypothetical protein M422DRAFT_262452 [Sphaerobolus stellatus SS14]
MASTDASSWSFNLRDYDCSDSGSEGEEEQENTVERLSSDSHLLKSLDLSAREDTASFKPNPWAIAKMNAVCRANAKQAPQITVDHAKSSAVRLSSPTQKQPRSDPAPKLTLYNPSKHILSTAQANAAPISEKRKSTELVQNKGNAAKSVDKSTHIKSQNIANIFRSQRAAASKQNAREPVSISIHAPSQADNSRNRTVSGDVSIKDTTFILPQSLGRHFTSGLYDTDIRGEDTPNVDIIPQDSGELERGLNASSVRMQERTTNDRSLTPFTTPPAKSGLYSSPIAIAQEIEDREIFTPSLPLPQNHSPPKYPSQNIQRYTPDPTTPISSVDTRRFESSRPIPEYTRIRDDTPHNFQVHKPSPQASLSPDPLFSRLKPRGISNTSLHSTKRKRDVPAYSFADEEEWSTLPRSKKPKTFSKASLNVPTKFSLPIALPRGQGISSSGRKLTLYKPPPRSIEKEQTATILNLKKVSGRSDAEELSRLMAEEQKTVETEAEDSNDCNNIHTDSAKLYSSPPSSPPHGMSSPSPLAPFSLGRTSQRYPATRRVLKERKKAVQEAFESLDLPSCGMIYQDGTDAKEIQIMIWDRKAIIGVDAGVSFDKTSEKGAVASGFPKNIKSIIAWINNLELSTETPTKGLLRSALPLTNLSDYTIKIEDVKLLVSVTHAVKHALAYWENLEHRLDFHLQADTNLAHIGGSWGSWDSAGLFFKKVGPPNANTIEGKDEVYLNFVDNLPEDATDIYHPAFGCTIFVKYIEFHTVHYHKIGPDPPSKLIYKESRQCWIQYVYIGDDDPIPPRPVDGYEDEEAGRYAPGTDEEESGTDRAGQDGNAEGSSTTSTGFGSGTCGYVRKVASELTRAEASIMLRRYIALKSGARYSMVHSDQVSEIHKVGDKMSVEETADCFAIWLLEKDFITKTVTGKNAVTIGFLPWGSFVDLKEEDPERRI